MNPVETLIPHRAPFLYLDQLISVSPEQIIGSKIFSDADQFLTGSFPEFAYVPGVVLIEAMAQCGGAGIKQLGLDSGVFGFASIENALFLRGLSFGTEFRMVIQNVKIAERYFRQSGIGYAGHQACLELTWTCVKIQ